MKGNPKTIKWRPSSSAKGDWRDWGGGVQGALSARVKEQKKTDKGDRKKNKSIGGRGKKKKRKKKNKEKRGKKRRNLIRAIGGGGKNGRGTWRIGNGSEKNSGKESPGGDRGRVDKLKKGGKKKKAGGAAGVAQEQK